MTERERLQVLLVYFTEQTKECEKQFYTFPDSTEKPNYFQVGRASAFNKSASLIQDQIEQLDNPKEV